MLARSIKYNFTVILLAIDMKFSYLCTPSLQQRKSFALFGPRRPTKETGGRSRNLLVLAQEYVEYHTQSFIKAVHQLDALLLRKYQRVSLVCKTFVSISGLNFAVDVLLLCIQCSPHPSRL